MLHRTKRRRQVYQSSVAEIKMWRKWEDSVVKPRDAVRRKIDYFAVSACARPASEFVRFARAAVRRREWPHSHALVDTGLLSVVLLFTPPNEGASTRTVG